MRVVVIAPEAVDLIVGCGGYVSRLDREGHEVVGVNLTREDHNVTVAAAKLCGYSDLELAKVESTGTPPSMRELQDWIQKQLRSLEPDIVISPWLQDGSSDHRRVAEMVETICVPWDLGSSVRRVLMYRRAGEAPGFRASVRVRLRDSDSERKRSAYELFPQARFADCPVSWRSIESRMGEAGCTVGVTHAEEFVLLWEKV